MYIGLPLLEISNLSYFLKAKSYIQKDNPINPSFGNSQKMNIEERILAILNQRFNYDAELILRFLNYQRYPNVEDNFRTTHLHMVVSDSLNYLEIVEYLYGLGANINVQNSNHLTALYLAVLRKNYKIADFLINNGASVNIQGLSGKTALNYLIDDIRLLKLYNEQDKLIKSLCLFKRMLQSGADPNLPDILGETPLMQAVSQNDFGIVKELLKFGGNVNLRNINSDTCLHLVTRSIKPNKEILVELVKHGACVNCFNRKGISVMDFILQHYPAEEGIEAVKLLIKTATLVNWEKKIFFELGANYKVCLEEFCDSCYTEVSRMKSCAFANNSNLCRFALNGGNASQEDKSSGNGTFDEVLETLVKDEFPIYEDFICTRFGRTFLIEKSLEINVFARNEKKVIYLNSDIISDLGPYLSDKDLFNLVRAYSKPDILYIKNDKINQ